MGYVRVKWYKRGATWNDGSTRMCVRCGIEDRLRRKQAVVTAFRRHTKPRPGGTAVRTDARLPVGYCGDHIPDELREEAPEWVDTGNDH